MTTIFDTLSLDQCGRARASTCRTRLGPHRACATVGTRGTIFDTLPLDQLRTRTSEKWRRYPADVLPLFVAEMDVPQAEPVVRAVHDAMRRGDTGYPAGHGFAEAFAGFAADRWGWDVDVARTRMAADVMVGVTEVLRLLTDPGDAVVISPPVYPPFTAFLQHAGRHVVHAPLAHGRLDLGGAGLRVRRAARARSSRRLPAVQPAQPDRHAAHRRRAGGGRRAGARSTASGWSPTRSTRRSCPRRARGSSRPRP